MKVIDIRTEFNGVYGAPRITTELNEVGEIITEKTVAKIVRSLGIVGISPIGTGLCRVVSAHRRFSDALSQSSGS